MELLQIASDKGLTGRQAIIWHKKKVVCACVCVCVWGVVGVGVVGVWGVGVGVLTWVVRIITMTS